MRERAMGLRMSHYPSYGDHLVTVEDVARAACLIAVAGTWDKQRG
jgi:hypothetical protein